MIYIPVWLDKNDGNSSTITWNRFIYIPVWLDKNNTSSSKTFRNNKIYIPVWLDKNYETIKLGVEAGKFTFQYG